MKLALVKLQKLTDNLLRDTILPLVLKIAGEEGIEQTDGVGECSCCGVAVGSLLFLGAEVFNIPLIDFLSDCLAFCRGRIGEESRFASDATFPSLFFLLLGPSSSPK